MTSADRGPTAIVTGGAGYLGTHVVRELVAHAQPVVIIDDLSSGTQVADDLLGHPLVRILHTDLRHNEEILSIFNDVQPSVVFHLAALHFIPACIANPLRTLSINVLGTQSVLDGCARVEQPPTLVFASTADVYRPQVEPHHEDSPVGSDNVYGLSKFVGEELIAHSARTGHCRPVIARLFNLYGPGETNPHVIPEIMNQLKVSNDVRLGNTSPRRDYVYVHDAAHALFTLSREAKPGTTVNVGTGFSYSVDDIISTIAALIQRDIRVTTDPLRFRASDRPNLQNDPTLLRTIGSDLLRTDVNVGLRRLLEHEGLMPPSAASS